MKESHDGPSTVLRALFQVPVWLYQGHLGFLFFGRLIAIAHRGRTSGNRYVSGLEVLERSDNELFVFSAWGTTSDWYRNIAVNGVETLWDGTKRTDALVRIVDADEADGILSNYEKAHPRLARFFMPRMYPGYDFTDESRRTLAATGTIVAFSRVDSVNDRIGSYGWRDVWPRPSTESLPPGQRVSTVMPRFSSRPTVAPPRIPERPQLEVTGAVTIGLQLDLGRLHQLPRTEMVEDFHCVTTWTIPQLTWAGWKFADVWEQLITPDAAPDPQATHVRVRGADGYWAVLDLEDALGSEVMLADSLKGRPLDPLHGAPLRLVSPRQYAYKSVKHVTAISVHNRAPPPLRRSNRASPGSGRPRRAPHPHRRPATATAIPGAHHSHRRHCPTERQETPMTYLDGAMAHRAGQTP